MKRFTTAVFSLVITTGLPVLTHAADSAAARYNLVYTTADFNSPASVQALHERIVKTARSHCPSYFVSRSMADTRTCVRDVVSNLVRVIDNPRLNAYAQGDTFLEVAGDTGPADSKS